MSAVRAVQTLSLSGAERLADFARAQGASVCVAVTDAAGLFLQEVTR